MNKFTSTLDRLALEGKLDGLKKKGTSSNTSIDINLIKPDPDQPRREFDQQALEELANSIKKHGVLQDITVQPKNDDGEYLIVFGERRYRAALIAGLKKLNVVIKTVTDDLREVQLIENIQREDLSTMEIAGSINQLIAKGMKRDKIAQKLGWNKHTITQYANIAKMPEALQKLAQQGATVRTLNELFKAWKINEHKTKRFIEATNISDITRARVSALNDKIGNNSAHPSLLPSSDKKSKKPKIAIRCKHQNKFAQILIDKMGELPNRIRIKYEEDNSIVEAKVEEISLIAAIEV